MYVITIVSPVIPFTERNGNNNQGGSQCEKNITFVRQIVCKNAPKVEKKHNAQPVNGKQFALFQNKTAKQIRSDR